jgi:hypothetical protein
MRVPPQHLRGQTPALLETAVLAEYRPLVKTGHPKPEQVIIALDTLLQMRTAGVILIPPASTTLGCTRSTRSGSAGSSPSTNLAGRSA